MKNTNGQRVDEKNVVICLVIIFTPRVMDIKMSKMAHFFYFLLTTAKNQSQFGHNSYEQFDTDLAPIPWAKEWPLNTRTRDKIKCN